MPDSHYVPVRYPPSVLDLILINSFPLVLSGVSGVLGIQIMLAAFSDSHVSRGLSESSVTVQIATSLLLLVSGLLVYVGTFNPRERFNKLTALVIRRAGATGLAAGWLTFGVAVTFTGNQFGTATAQTTVGIGLSFAVYAVTIYLRERQMRREISIEEAALHGTS